MAAKELAGGELLPDEWESETASGVKVTAHVTRPPYGRVEGVGDLLESALEGEKGIFYEEHSQRFYKVIKRTEVWEDAVSAAQGLHLNGIPGRLAVITTEAQNAALAAYVNAEGQDVYIGGADKLVAGDWRWYDGAAAGSQFWAGDARGLPVKGAYVNWKNDHPKADKRVIKFKKNGEWESDDETHAHAFLVEWSASAVAPGYFTGNHGFSDSSANHHRSLNLTFRWDTEPESATSRIDHPGDDKQFGTILFSFNEPVRNPVLHFERLGERGGNESNSVEFRVLTPGVELRELWESGPHLETTRTTFRRRPNEQLSNPYPEVGPSGRGSVAGSIEFRGTYTSIELEWTGVGVEGGGSDEVEFLWDLPKAAAADSIRKEALEKEMRPLSEVPVLLPRYIDKYIADIEAAKQLGKALFWDQQVGSDGMSCASCHFHAGADSRTRNEVSPLPGNGLFDRLFSGKTIGPNQEFDRDGSDFPFHRKKDKTSNDLGNNVLFDNDDSASSSGVFHGHFISLRDALLEGESTIAENNDYSQPDPDGFLFDQKDGFLNVRRVEPRNTPTMINAVFNFRNFWDGRANFFFNGTSPFGPRDPDAGIYDSKGSKVSVLLDNASLASQAVGPPLSNLEMSSRNKAFAILGRKMLGVRPLALQRVHPQDSLLGKLASSERGLLPSYQRLIEQAFKPEWWDSDARISLNSDTFSQTEANFSFIWGISLMMYQSALVSDDAPVDRFLKGDSAALTTDQKEGMKIFMNEGRCISCHGGANFTNATTRYVRNEMINRMIVGNGEKAIYDEGFYNIGVRRTSDDLGLGAEDPFGNPLSFSRQAVNGINVDRLPFERSHNFEIDPHLPPQPGERVAVDGAFKTPNLRNVELTGPFFHNGGQATLEQVVEFYARGGDFSDANIDDLDADIQRIGSLVGDSKKIAQVAAFLRALTDERVRYKRGVFDHPELFIFHGHPNPGAGSSERSDNEPNLAEDSILILEAVGSDGSPHPVMPFLKGIIPGDVDDNDLIVETGKSGVAAVKAAAGIHKTPPPPAHNLLANIVAPGTVHPAESVEVRIDYESSSNSELWVRLLSGGSAIKSRHYVVAPGSGSVSFAIDLPYPLAHGSYEWTFALLPQGWNTFDDALVTATSPVSVVSGNSGTGGGEYPVTSDVIALYHFNGDYHDSSPNELHATSDGNVSRADNTGWMETPSGQVARFREAGDVLSVAIPDRLILPDAGSSFTIESRIFVREYKGWGNGNLPIIDLAQEWDTYLGLRDRKWGSDLRGPNVWAHNAEVVDARRVSEVLTANSWHQLRISYYGDSGHVSTWIDGALVGSVTQPAHPGHTTDWVLTIGNFDGDVDELVIRSIAGPPDNYPVSLPADTVAPTVVLSTPHDAVGGPYPVSVAFSEPVTGFELADIQVTNGLASSLTGSGAAYSFLVTPVADGLVTAAVLHGAAEDAAGNASEASDRITVDYAPDDHADDDVIAHYDFQGSAADRSGNGLHLKATGPASIAQGTAKFSGANQTLAASIPYSLVSQADRAFSVEARVLAREFVGWGNGNLPIISLHQDWDSSLSLQDDMWAPERAPAVLAGNIELLAPADWTALAPPGRWIKLKISYNGAGEAAVAIDDRVVAATPWQPNRTRTGDWRLTLGNFVGEIDDVKVRSAAMGGTGAVADLTALQQGILGEYFEGTAFDQLRFSRIDPSISFDWRSDSPGPQVSSEQFSVRWTGCVTPLYSETYTLRALANGGVRIWANDALLIDSWTATSGTTLRSASIGLRAGVPVPIMIEYFTATGAATMKLEWESTRQSRETVPQGALVLNETSTLERLVSSYPGSWGEWLSSPRSNGATASSPGNNLDGDDFVDLLEYALGESPGTGIPGFRASGLDIVSVGENEEQIDVNFRRPSSIGDIRYVLETSADSIRWEPVAEAADTTIVRHLDGTETVRYHGVDRGELEDKGFVRLRVDLDGSALSATTRQGAWYRTRLAGGYQTVGISVVRPPVFTGKVSAGFGETVQLDGGGDFSMLFDGDRSYYLEVRSGALEGHRMAVDPSRSFGAYVALAPGSPGNTIEELGSALAGNLVSIHAHHTIGEVFRSGRFKGGTDPALTDKIHFYRGDATGYSSFFLLKSGTQFDYWTSLANASLSDASRTPILPGEGLFIERESAGDLVLTTVGIVRDCGFVQPLKEGYNLVAEAYPVASSPAERRLRQSDGFTGALNPADADQILIWHGDTGSGAAGYQTYFLLDAGVTSGFRFWTEMDNARLLDRDDERLFDPARSVFILRNSASFPEYRFGNEP